jgi:membrane peptidoglycan carboxypeptidase
VLFRSHPHLLQSLTATDKPATWALNPANVKDVIDGMYAVVNGAGTGGRARLPGIEVCGKTGSAQLASNEYVKGAGAGRARDMRDNAWFVGFAPRSAPEIVVVALFEHGVHGQFAAPIVRDVMKAYFDKKVRMASQAQATAKLGSFGNALVPAAPAAPAAAARAPQAPEVSDDELIEKSKVSSDVPEGQVGAAPPPDPVPTPEAPGTVGPESVPGQPATRRGQQAPSPSNQTPAGRGRQPAGVTKPLPARPAPGGPPN